MPDLFSGVAKELHGIAKGLREHHASYSMAVERQAEILDAAPSPQWHPMDSAPKDRAVLIYGRVLGMQFKTFRVAGWIEGCWRSHNDTIEPVAWMPLPTAPPSTDTSGGDR